MSWTYLLAASILGCESVYRCFTTCHACWQVPSLNTQDLLVGNSFNVVVKASDRQAVKRWNARWKHQPRGGCMRNRSTSPPSSALLCSIHVNPNLVGYLQKSKTETLKYWQLTPNYSKVKLESTSGKAWGLLKIDEIHTSGPKYHDTSGQQCFLGQPLSTKSPGLLPSSFERNGDNFGQPQAKPFHVLRKASHVLILQRVLPRVSLDVHSACFASVVCTQYSERMRNDTKHLRMHFNILAPLHQTVACWIFVGNKKLLYIV